MKFMCRLTLTQLEEFIQNSYSVPIFKGYKAIDRRGVEKLIEELYATLPEDVKKARAYLRSINYELNSNIKKNTIYESLNALESALDTGLSFSRMIILKIHDLDQLLKQIQECVPEEILKAEILSR